MKTFFQSIKLLSAISYLLIRVALSEMFCPTKELDSDYFFFPEDNF